MEPTQDNGIARVQSLYDAGLFLQAWAAAQALGPLRDWPGTPGRVLAGRLASQLSADRLGDALILRAWRGDRAHPQAVFYGAMATCAQRGPLAALDLLQESGLLAGDDPLRWEATAYAAWLYACFRDFDAAERLISRALDATPTPWVWAQRAAISEAADRYPEALAAAQRAWQLNPSSRSAVQYVARFLALFERDDEAIAVLREAMKRIESARVAAQLATLEFEVGDYASALATLDRFDALTPLKDKGTIAWLAGQRCDALCRLGDLPGALAQARGADSGFYRQIATRLEQATAASRRCLLPVGFVRQHHMTCAPATLSALSRFWAQPADHLELAEEICYDGTSGHSQRRWASAHGWAVREFTADWDSARALLDAGIPFTLSTVHPGSAHLQAVVGYDEARGTLLIRDPFEHVHGEFAETPFFASYRSSGPRAMAMVPAGSPAQAALAALTLPEAAWYDLTHALQEALGTHDRDGAKAQLAALEAAAPGHRLTIGARRALASYDGDGVAYLAATDALLALYPDDVNLRLSRADSLAGLADRTSYLAYVGAQADGNAAHPLFRLRLAQALLEDGRDHAAARRLLRVLARCWNRAETLSALADAHWQPGGYRRAVDLYRLAAALEEADEGHARAYFRAARMVRDESTALAFLRDRVARLGRLSPQPSMTLYECFEELDRAADADATLAAALAIHADDGALRLFAARMASARGDAPAADEHLAQARPRCHVADWQRSAARIQRDRGELPAALVLWQAVATAAPLDLAAQRAVAGLLHELSGRAAVLTHLRALVERFPHHRGLGELLVDWLDEEPLAEQEAALRRLLAIAPTNAWAQRELAGVLARQQRFAEAQAEAEAALLMAPHAAAGHSVLGNVHFLAGRLAEARGEFRLALQLAVDADYPLVRLLEACADRSQRRAELAFVRGEMQRQVIFGDSVLLYQQHARNTLAADELDAQLDEVRIARPELWQTWVACLRQRVERQQYDAARALCDEALARFPLLPRMHLERAEVARLAGDREGERGALHEALRLSPGWELPARRLADACEADGDFAASRAVLEAALRHSPGDAPLHGYFGHALWQLGEREAALASFTRAVELDPTYRWAWQALHDRGAAAGSPDAAIALARRLAERRPGDLHAWMVVAQISDDDAEKLAALERAIVLSPLAIEPRERKIEVLVALRRFDEALAEAAADAWGGTPPVALRVKAARIVAARGDLPGGIERLRQALADDPGYAPGWEQLADWHAEREDWPAYLEAARALCAAAPNDGRALGYLAHALLRAEPDTDVRPHLRRALQLTPDYTYAGYELFDLEFAAGDLAAAEAALQALAAHVDNAYVQLRFIRLAARRVEHQEALDRYWKMWALPDEDPEPFRTALGVLEDAGWRADAGRVIERIVLEAGVNPHAGTVWAERRCARRWPWRRFAGFETVLANGAAGQRAAQALFRHFAERKDRGALHRLLRRHGAVLRDDPETHGLAAYALLKIDAPRAAVRWFGDWRMRAAPPWALLNLVASLRDLGRDGEAGEVGRHALTLARDHTFGEHASWLAVDAALAGERSHAERLLAGIDEARVSGYYQFVLGVVRALLAADDPAPAARGSALRRARREFVRARAACPQFQTERALRRLMWRAALAVGRACGPHPSAALPLGVLLYFSMF